MFGEHVAAAGDEIFGADALLTLDAQYFARFPFGVEQVREQSASRLGVRQLRKLAFAVRCYVSNICLTNYRPIGAQFQIEYTLFGLNEK